MRLHHVQISMPRGQEVEARRFYAEALGLQEVEKPPSLVARRGCWFRAFDRGEAVAEIHLGVEDPFIPAKKNSSSTERRARGLGASLTSTGWSISWTATTWSSSKRGTTTE